MRGLLVRAVPIAAVLVCAVTAFGQFLDPNAPDVLKFTSVADGGFSRVGGETLVSRGAAANVRCKSSQEMAVMRFDLSSIAGWTVTEAELHVGANSTSLLYAADVSTICVPWIEGNTSGGFINGSPGEPCWDWRQIPVNMSNPQPDDWWTVPGSNFAYATFGNGGSISSYAHPDGQGFTTYTASTPGGTKTFYRIKVDPAVVHAMALDQYGLTLSDTRGYFLQNNTIYMREQWGGGAGPWLYVKGGITDVTPPLAMAGMAAEVNWNGEVLLSWMAPADSGAGGKAFGYDVRYATSPISEANFMAATQAPRWRIPRPQEPGADQQMLLPDLTPGLTYYFAMRAYDQAGNATPIVTTTLPLPASQTVESFADGGFAVPAPAAAVPSAGGAVRYWAASEYTKVNPVTGNRMADGYAGTGADGYKKGNPVWDAANNKVVLRAARNEVVAFQMILERLVTNLTNVQVSVSDLVGSTGTIAASPNIELFRSWYVYSGGRYYPDACIPLAAPFGTTFAIPNATNGISGQTNQAVWVDIYVPKSAGAGTYSGTLTVTATQLAQPLQIDVELAVRQWELPDKVSYIVDLNGYNTPWDWNTSGQDVALTKLRYFQLAHKHRQNVNTVPYSHSLNSDKTARVNGDRIPFVFGSGAGLYVPTNGWSNFDAWWGKYLDGSAFTAAEGYNGPGMGTPIPAFYTPFFESWPLSSYFWYDALGLGGAYWYGICPGPSLTLTFLRTAPDPAKAYPPDYETGVKNIVRAFAEHAQAKGWHDTYMQFYLNNKYSWGNATNPHSQFWNLDEPSEGECMRALGYFNRVIREGAESANAPDIDWHFRIDISDRTGLHRGEMDGLVNLWCSSGITEYHGLIPQRQMNWTDEQWWYYGGGASPTSSEMTNTKRFLQVWAWGADGCLPYWQSYATNWTNADSLSVVYSGQSVPGYGLYNGAIASVRMKEMRRGQQDVEYLAYLAGNVDGWDRAAAIRALQARYADGGGGSYNGMNEADFFQLREDIAATVPAPLPGDANGDGIVNVIDLLMLAHAFATSQGDANYDSRVDFNNDGVINVIDLLTLANNWMATQ